MNITIALVFVNGTPTTRIESQCLVECALEGENSGAGLDNCRRSLEQAFSEITGESNVEVLFPELCECENLL